MVQSRNTRQKELIEKTISNFTTFFNAQEVLEEVNKKDKKIGIATVYRFLKELKKQNVIYSYQCQGKTIYSNQKKSHCHFTCSKTGEVFHFEIDNLDFLKDKIPGKIQSFQIEINGICTEEEQCSMCNCKH